MRLSRVIALTATLLFLPLINLPNLAAPRELTSLNANAQGKGTLIAGKETFKIYSVVVKFKEDGTGEIIVVSDLTVFLNCSWSANADPSKGIDVKLQSGNNVGPSGSGKLFLKPDAKSIASLTLAGTSNTLKRKLQLNFVAD
ncbi:MAG TPA: hypothetical protein VGN86_02925 [Pyrinomonadaceae bacterium]|jgi:hypothetical protein|nr:hypothetical protein [Pyrinomonadaceae bacterium]